MADEKNNILDMDLSEEDEDLLRETLSTWKDTVYEKLMEEIEEKKQQVIEELEEKNLEYKEELKEEFTSKLLDALKEMKEELKAQAVAEVYDNNPELKVLEQVKELIAPTLQEDYLQNTFAEEMQTLRERIEEMEEEKRIDEGAKRLAELVAPYSEKTQKIILSLIPEGDADEVTEKYEWNGYTLYIFQHINEMD
jgi:5-formyltetrahydrofolate cyclo-ligase